MESKAKLMPLDQKGDAVMAEICGTAFAARRRKYVENHGGMKIEQSWWRFKEKAMGTRPSQIVGEIRKAGPVDDCWWIPGDLNIAGIITRGGTPENLREDSTWQYGPVGEWPKKSTGEIAAHCQGE